VNVKNCLTDKESVVILGKIKRMKELNKEEKMKFNEFANVMFLWKLACE